MSVRVVLNHAGVAELLKSAGVASELEERGNRVLATARALAPVVTGEYRDSLAAETDEHPTRVVVHVLAGVSYAMDVEAEHGVLARALDSGA